MTKVFLENSNKIKTLNRTFINLHPGDYITEYDDNSELICYKVICFMHLLAGALPVLQEITFGGFIDYSDNYMKHMENLNKNK